MYQHVIYIMHTHTQKVNYVTEIYSCITSLARLVSCSDAGVVSLNKIECEWTSIFFFLIQTQTFGFQHCNVILLFIAFFISTYLLKIHNALYCINLEAPLYYGLYCIKTEHIHTTGRTQVNEHNKTRNHKPLSSSQSVTLRSSLSHSTQ